MDTPPLTPATLLLTFDILGTFVFAMSGAAAGVKKRLDVFGVCVVAGDGGALHAGDQAVIPSRVVRCSVRPGRSFVVRRRQGERRGV